jgi:hypothetical protein
VHSQTLQLHPPSASDRRLLVFTALVVCAASTWLSFASAGFLEADGVTHYLYARFALDSPSYFVDVWARPVRMLIHALPAHFFGLHGVRAASLAVLIGTAWIVYRIATRLHFRWPALAGVFLLVQPLLFLHSFSELTELPFALLGSLALLSMLARRWWLFALICGLMPASRPEGAAFVLLAIVMLVLHRKAYWIPLTLLPVVVWNHLGWVLWGTDAGPWWRWLIDRFPYSSHSLYPAGPMYRFLAVLPAVVSPLVLPAVLLGTIGTLTARAQAEKVSVTILAGARLPDVWLVALIPWGFLAVHTFLHVAGRMSSSGEPRYLLATAPFWALLACKGWSMMADRFRWRRPILWAALASLVPVVVNLAYPVVPLKRQPDAVLCEEIADWYRNGPLQATYPKVLATHPLVYFYLDRKIEGVTQDVVRAAPPGTMFVFDNLYASYNSDSRRVVTPEAFEAAGWIRHESNAFGLAKQTWIIFLSPQPTP